MFNNIIRKILYKNIKGTMGELSCRITSSFYLEKEYKLLTDVVIPAYDGTTQIDQIIFSKYGIFVLEIKTFTGWIFGNPNEKKWTQITYNKKSEFQNPLNQNYKHIKSLQELLKLHINKFKSVIVFADEASIKTPMPQNVCKGNQYINYIKSFREIILKDEEISEAMDKIKNCHLSSAEHIKNIRKTAKQKCEADENNAPICAKCKKTMILRTAKNGKYQGKKFWGCSGYPECNYIINIK